MGMCKPSGGKEVHVGRLGSLPKKSKVPNMRMDLYDYNGNLIQQR